MCTNQVMLPSNRPQASKSHSFRHIIKGNRGDKGTNISLYLCHHGRKTQQQCLEDQCHRRMQITRESWGVDKTQDTDEGIPAFHKQLLPLVRTGENRPFLSLSQREAKYARPSHEHASYDKGDNNIELTKPTHFKHWQYYRSMLTAIPGSSATSAQ